MHCRWPLPKHHSASRTFPGGSVFAAWKRTLHCYNFVVLDGESYGRGRLTSRSFSATCWPVWIPRKTTSPSKRIKSSSPPQKKFAHLVAKARWSARRKGDWKEIAKLKAKYSILDLPLPACAAAVSFVATLFAGVDLQGSDGRGVSQLPICRRHTFLHFFFFAQRMFVKPKRMFVIAPNELLPNVR